MSNNPFRHDREELRELLHQYENMQAGKGHAFIEEEGFLQVIDYYDEREKFADALQAANFAIEQYPYSASLLIKKADVLISLRKFQESLFTLEKAALFAGNDPALYVIKTDALLALGRLSEADELLAEIVPLFEGEEKIDLLFELADVFDDYESFEKVFDCLKMILQEDATNEEALYKICFWTDFTGRNEEGIKLHQRIIEQQPYSELAWFNLGAAYQGIKLYEKAIDAYQYAVAIDEKFDYAYRNMGDAYIQLKKFKEAIEVLEKVLELARPEAVIYEAIGHCYDKINNHTQARSHYKKASHLNPEDSQLHYKIACTYMNEGAWSNAVKSLQTALKKHLMQPAYNLAIGRCYLEMGNIQEAVVFLGNVVRIKPKNVTGWTELLKCLYQGQMFEEGLDYASLAFEQTDSKPVFVYYTSAFLFALGRSKEALIYLEHALVANAKLVKQFIEINPSLLQHQSVVELLAKYKKGKSRK